MEATVISNDTLPTAAAPLDLDTLCRRIESEHKAALRCATSSLEHARQVGCYLAQAKRQVGHGGWLSWLERSVSFDRFRAAEYMRVAEHWPEIEAQMCNDRTFGLRAALKYLAEPWETPADSDEEMSLEAAQAIVDLAQESVEEAEEQLEEEAATERERTSADRETAVLDYCARAVARLRKRLARLGKRGQPLLRVLARLERLVEDLEAVPAA